MARGRWLESAESIGKEAFAVLIQGKKPSRIYTKKMLLGSLDTDEIYIDFLKICLDNDHSDDLRMFRKGVLMIVRAMGPESVAKAVGVSRVSLYRMLSRGGNPRLSNLLKLLRYLGVWFWIVDDEFIGRKGSVVRPKDQKSIGKKLIGLSRYKNRVD